MNLFGNVIFLYNTYLAVCNFLNKLRITDLRVCNLLTPKVSLWTNLCLVYLLCILLPLIVCLKLVWSVLET